MNKRNITAFILLVLTVLLWMAWARVSGQDLLSERVYMPHLQTGPSLTPTIALHHTLAPRATATIALHHTLAPRITATPTVTPTPGGIDG